MPEQATIAHAPPRRLDATIVALVFASVASLAAFLPGCSQTPTQPSAVQKSPAPVITAITIDGPATIAPGASGRFTAVAHRSDGSSEDVTASAAWRVFFAPPRYDSNVLRSVGAGIFQATAPDHGA